MKNIINKISESELVKNFLESSYYEPAGSFTRPAMLTNELPFSKSEPFIGSDVDRLITTTIEAITKMANSNFFHLTKCLTFGKGMAICQLHLNSRKSYFILEKDGASIMKPQSS